MASIYAYSRNRFAGTGGDTVQWWYGKAKGTLGMLTTNYHCNHIGLYAGAIMSDMSFRCWVDEFKFSWKKLGIIAYSKLAQHDGRKLGSCNSLGTGQVRHLFLRKAPKWAKHGYPKHWKKIIWPGDWIEKLSNDWRWTTARNWHQGQLKVWICYIMVTSISLFTAHSRKLFCQWLEIFLSACLTQATESWNGKERKGVHSIWMDSMSMLRLLYS